jgi:predicted nucleic acid-binding protein
MPAIIDTSAAYALTVADDPEHVRMVEAVRLEHGRVILPSSVLVETCLLMRRRIRPGAEMVFVRGLARSGWRREDLEDADLARISDLFDQYADACLGFVDTSIIAIAERLGVTRIFTLDRRDFSIVRPRHVEAFEILP